MAEIVLTTLNAKYAHASFGLRYLLANMGPLQERTTLLEFEISGRAIDIVDRILSHEPKIVGIGVYIWNVPGCEQIVALLKKIRPDVIVVLGGPEVSYETESQPICALADYVITGEADLEFAALCEKLLNGRRPLNRIIPATLPEFQNKTIGLKSAAEGNALTVIDAARPAVRTAALPYAFYDDVDLKQRVVYVEASRGCPFKCEFCLSSLDVPLRNVPTEPFLAAMQDLFNRGLRQFKFVDRTFNLNLTISKAILQFFLERYEPGLFLHFEMIPDRLPETLRELIAKFPAGSLQFEVGVQTFNDQTAELISRRQDNAKLEENFRWLREHSGVHIHADLIVGLPGEDMASFGRGFDRLVNLRPQEIQVGMLKRLRGTPICRHDATWEMTYSPHPPYEILKNKRIDFNTMQRLRRFARYWDLIANSGNFVQTTPLIWALDVARASRPCSTAETAVPRSPFESFLQLSDWLHATTGQTHAISLSRQIELLFEFLTTQRDLPPQLVAETLWADYQRLGRSDRPKVLAAYVQPADTRTVRKSNTASRQSRHLAGQTDAR